MTYRPRTGDTVQVCGFGPATVGLKIRDRYHVVHNVLVDTAWAAPASAMTLLERPDEIQAHMVNGNVVPKDTFIAHVQTKQEEDMKIEKITASYGATIKRDDDQYQNHRLDITLDAVLEPGDVEADAQIELQRRARNLVITEAMLLPGTDTWVTAMLEADGSRKECEDRKEAVNAFIDKVADTLKPDEPDTSIDSLSAETKAALDASPLGPDAQAALDRINASPEAKLTGDEVASSVAPPELDAAVGMMAAADQPETPDPKADGDGEEAA